MCRGARVILFIAILLASSKLYAEQFAYVVHFTNKNNTPFSLSAPLSYLSPRSIERRTVQGIAIDSTDLPVNQAYIDSVLTLTGGKLHGSSHWFNLCVVLVNDSVAIHSLDNKDFISSTRFAGYYADSLHRPAPTTNHQGTFSQAYKTTSDASHYGNTWLQTSIVNGNHLHDDGYTGNGKLIAVIDAGFIDIDTHPGFNHIWATGRLIDSYNFTLANTNILGYDTHGTRAFSTIAGYIPGTYVGSAPMATFALYISEDNNSEQYIELVNMLFAAERADSIGADIISTSLGYNVFDNPADNFTFDPEFDGNTTIAAMAANMATKKGILFVATAGNEGNGGWNKILTPGDADSALTIGSIDATGATAPTSGYGPNADGQVKPDVCGMGQAAAVFIGVGYGNQNGTSFSTPQIAGWAACLWQAYPSAKPSQIKEVIVRCASLYSAPTPHSGYGIPDLRCAKQVMLQVNNTPTPYAPESWIAVAPNPFTNEISLIISPDTERNIEFVISDISGKTVMTAAGSFSKGYNTPFPITLNNLPAGVYILKAVSPTSQMVVKLIKN